MPFLLMKDRVVEALQWLQERSIRTAPNDLVFCYDTGERMGDTWWKKRFTAALKIQKIDRIGRRLSPHSFRHTLNTLLRAANKDSAKIRAALGWKQESTQDGYTEFKVEDLEDLRLD
jgi:integrase